MFTLKHRDPCCVTVIYLQLYQLSKRILGQWLTEKVLRASVFGQFAGGVSETDTEKVVRKLVDKGISSIWFFSIERDLG